MSCIKLDLTTGNQAVLTHTRAHENIRDQMRVSSRWNNEHTHTTSTINTSSKDASAVFFPTPLLPCFNRAQPNSATHKPQPTVERVQEFITHNPTLNATISHTLQVSCFCFHATYIGSWPEEVKETINLPVRHTSVGSEGRRAVRAVTVQNKQQSARY